MATVCVTGASGFLGSWLVKRLLEEGYYVRGTVRDPDDPNKTSHLWKLSGAQERLTLFKADLLSEGVFDSIVDGCEGVFHSASAVTMTAKDPQAEIVDPAVLGTLNVLRACKKPSTVKRVVYTSSTSAVRFAASFPQDAFLDESIWSSSELCRENKFWYPLSKTLAEQAAWEFAKSNNLDLVTIIPSLIVGYTLPPVPTASAADCLSLFQGNDKRFENFKFIGYVHLDDVATAHIRAFENPAANGRYICSAVDATNTELTEFLAERYPDYKIPTFPASKKPYKGLCNDKLVNFLGMKLKGLEEMFDDVVEGFKRGGHLDPK
ncbi:hypothetical protein SELMODRAFT_233749 [Selaginella moellendorffii]|uniref:Flavanone 4-reductase n=1 Tax=Selaginella moellendorffii TaxID=88036 RepID=D8SDS9_SELML|nr:tetraketide alpha-pyrone reductase 1 isoform X2 [Selaginella moellendorffii]XP_024542313.1 tetraketide alpha-pyrone reductase 1 isoform X2 [Selaginella moellendorffii]EFJ17393.1 hypothetical protein SELMODRAFT_233749 [Selaginella moellendorffii]|eukprot:XP_002981578.1 tetraketide alpha-pyrone reductase 1 isoform X2 [Selaginella moellendorffii]